MHKKKITKHNIDDLVFDLYEYLYIEMSNSSYDILNNPNDPNVSKNDFLKMFSKAYRIWCEEVIYAEYDVDALHSVCQLLHDIDSCCNDLYNDPEATKNECFVGVLEGIQNWKSGALL